MENFQFLGKEWEFLIQEDEGSYTKVTEYTHEDLCLTIKHFYDPMFGEKFTCIINDEPGGSLVITSGEKPNLTYALRSLERKARKIGNLFKGTSND